MIFNNEYKLHLIRLSRKCKAFTFFLCFYLFLNLSANQITTMHWIRKIHCYCILQLLPLIFSICAASGIALYCFSYFSFSPYWTERVRDYVCACACICEQTNIWKMKFVYNTFFCIIYSICVFIFFCIVTFAQQWTCNVKVIVVFSIFLLLLLLLSLLLLLLSLVYFTFGFLYVSQHTQLHANIRYWIVAYQSYCFILLS